MTETFLPGTEPQGSLRPCTAAMALGVRSRVSAPRCQAHHPLTWRTVGPHPQRHDPDDERCDGTSCTATCGSTTVASRASAGRRPTDARTTTIDADGGTRAARLHPDAHSSVPDAVPRARGRSAAARLAARRACGRSRPRTTSATLARGRAARGRRAPARRHDVGADDGDGARHGRGVRRARADRAARRRRQVPDERARRRAGALVAVRRARRSTRAWRCIARWHGAADGRLRAALAPRFAISCSRDLLEATAAAVGRARTARSHARVGAARGNRSRARAHRHWTTSRISRRSASPPSDCARRTACG